MRRLLGGGYGSPPMEISDVAAAFADYDGPAEEPPDMDDLKARAGGAPSEEDLLLLALFGDDATRLIETLRGRARCRTATPIRSSRRSPSGSAS